MAQELELKIQINSDQLTLLKNWLRKNTEYINSSSHKEYYLSNPKDPFLFENKDGLKDARSYMRVRFSDKGDSVCLKKFHDDPLRPGVYSHCDEYETGVEDGKELLDLFMELGYTDVTKVEKKRDKYNTKDFEIVIDEVKNLGQFVEVELNEEVEDTEKGRMKIYEFLRMVGIVKFKVMTRGYVSMLWNPDKDFGEEVTL
jgi:predicted adenylyl cyclase CyaB